MELPDGSVIPSFLGVIDTSRPEPTGMWTNTMLRHGEVTDIIFPDDTRSLSHKFIEYKVRVQHRDATGYATIEYGNCYVANLFGGIGDKLRFTLRKDSRFHDLGTGSKVLILCISGETQNAVIIGGIRDSQETVKDQRTDGHNLFFEFNGLQSSINDAGEFTVTRLGKTQSDGTLDSSVKTSLVNQILSMTVDGKITIGYSSIQGDKPFIAWDENANTVLVHGNSQVKLEANSGPIQLSTSTGVQINGATEAFLQGTSYRAAQQSMNNIMKAALTLAINATPGLPSGPSKVALVNAFQAMKAAIEIFESASSNYLSKKHFWGD